MDPLKIIYHFYPENDRLRRGLLCHSSQVRDKALQIANHNPKLKLDREILRTGAMLHDIGIRNCNAPDIHCHGTEPYLRHGITGAEMLREYGKNNGLDLEVYARICERHTGSGLTAEEIRKAALPLPEKDFLPETPEEKLICLADKFYSKSGSRNEKKLKKIMHSMERFGEDPLKRFQELSNKFQIKKIPVVTPAIALAIGLIFFDLLVTGLTCLSFYGRYFLPLKLLYLIIFLIRCCYTSWCGTLNKRDIWIYEIIFLAITWLIFLLPGNISF